MKLIWFNQAEGIVKCEVRLLSCQRKYVFIKFLIIWRHLWTILDILANDFVVCEPRKNKGSETIVRDKVEQMHPWDRGNDMPERPEAD